MDPVELLTGALAIYGPSTREQEVAAYLVDAMARLGLRAFRDDAGNAVGIVEPAESPESPEPLESPEPADPAPAVRPDAPLDVVLLGHMDTAPGFIPVRREGDLLYGRGAVDARGPLCAFMCAAARAGVQRAVRIVVIGAVEEENASSRGARFAASRYSPAFCVVGEPSGWDRITVGYKGRLVVGYRFEQPRGHSAGEARGAPEAAFAFWSRLTDLAAARNAGKTGAFAVLDPALLSIRTGDDPFVESVSMTISIRIPPDQPIPDLESDILALARGAAIEFSGREPAVRVEKNTPVVRAFLSAIRAHGGDPRFTVKTGTSDMNVVHPAWRCPMVSYGAGDSSLDHTPGEHIDLKEYARSIDVLTDVLRDLVR